LQSEIETLVKAELSGESAKLYTAQITRFHRVQASTMFYKAALYIKESLSNMGFKDAIIERYVSDGKQEYWTWTSPVGWEVTSAQLHQLEPEKKLIIRYKDVPTCLHTYSKSTPPRGITAELVDVGEGTKPEDYEGKEVKGKLVLASGRAKEVHEQAVYKYGAIGVITDTLTHEMKNVRESIDIPDAHAYQSIWPTGEEINKVTFGFSLSRRQGNHLKALLEEGKRVTLKAEVEARLFPGYLDVVTTTIKGDSRSNEEILLVAHLCHPKPSANDNASGSGLLLEIARTMQSLIQKGKVARPSRTVRFLWVPETYGTIAYLHRHLDSKLRFIAGINLDMIGQNQALCKSTLRLDKTPDSNPSFLNDYVFSLLERSVQEFDEKTAFGAASTFRYSINPFSGGSDHAEFNDSTIGVPCVMLLQWPDIFYHTSLDSIDKVSEESLKRIGWITTVASLTLADATKEEAVYIANLTRLGGIIRIQEACKEAITALFKTIESNIQDAPMKITEVKSNFQNKIRHIIWREKKAVESIKRISEETILEEIIEKFKEDLEDYGKLEVKRFTETVADLGEAYGVTLTQQEKTEIAEKARGCSPKRLFKGTFNWGKFKRALGEAGFRRYRELSKLDVEFRKKTYEVFNFMNGKRTLYDIERSVSAEYSETELETLLKFIEDLEKTGFVSLT